MIQAGIAGLGWWGRQIVSSLQHKSGEIRFVRGVDADPEAARPFAAQMGFPVTGDYRDLLADPDVEAVLIATPHDLHEEQVALAAAAGRHVFCEKPLALTAAAARRAVAACEASGVVLGVGHERRFEPAMIEIKRMVDEGELGTLLHVEANFSHSSLINLPAGNWRVSDPFVPPAMTGMGIHLTDSFLQLLGPVERLFAQPSWRVADWKAGDGIAVSFRFASGVTGLLSSLMATPFFMRFQLFGTEAWVEARDTVRPEATGTVHFTVRRRDGEPSTREIPSIDSVAANIEAFARAAAGQAPYPFSREEKIGNIAVLEAIARSVETGEAVAVPAAG